ncbi:MAG: ribbon-helix-helix protein, CopG family [Candidatus Magnetoovum sp. WYHC-5]|nr:ribbon-helix-helix protein, CopG family [Candidatus Magnetoovum sp. WYHC-5]
MLRSTKLITISILPDLLNQAKELAKKENRTMSELFREALRLYIEDKKETWQDLRKYGNALAKKQGILEEDVDDIVADFRHRANS